MSKNKNRNLTVKILALFISILLWSYVRGDENPNIIREIRGVNVEIKNERLLNEAGLVVIEPEEIIISVKIQGRKSDVNLVTKEKIEAQVDLAEVTKGSKKVRIDIEVPYNVEIVDKSETYASFEIDSIVTVEREVEIDIQGDDVNHIVEESVPTPRSVTVSGPSIYMDNLARVVSSIDVGNISTNGVMRLPVKLLDKDGNEIKELKVKPSKVEVSFLLLKTKEVPVEASLVGSLKDDYEISSYNTNPSTVVIKGLEEDIENITKIQTQDVNLAEVNKDESINVGLKLPSGVNVNEGKEKVTVNIKLKNNNIEPPEVIEPEEDIIKEVSIPIEEVELINKNEDLEASFDVSNPEEIGISIEGNKDIIENLEGKDINLSVDLNELEDGIHEVKIAIGDIKDIIVKSVHPESIKIKLELKE